MMLTKRDLLAGIGVTLAAPMVIHTRALADGTSSARHVGLDYFKTRALDQASLCASLTEALKLGDLGAAEAAYASARPPYEEIEVHAGAFADIDADIDARPYAIEGGESNAAFKGFHRIEALIYRDRNLEAAVPVAEKLERSIEQLSNVLSEGDRFSDALFFEGLIALPEEVAAKKISSEEETWSDLSLIVFRHNFLGVQSQFAGFAPSVGSQSEQAVDRATLAFAQAQAVLEPYFEGGGVTRYSDLRARERGEILHAAYDIRAAMEQSAEVLGLI